MQDAGRKYKRIDTNWIVRIEARERTAADRIRNVSSTGVFIETPNPFPPSSLIEFDFHVPGRPETVHATGLVRWVNDGRHDDLPVGMGIEFSHVSASIRTNIQKMVAGEMAEDPLAPLKATPEHQAILAVYVRRVGTKVSLDDLVAETGLPADALRMTLIDFTLFDLVGLNGDTIQFKLCEDPALAQALAVA